MLKGMEFLTQRVQRFVPVAYEHDETLCRQKKTKGNHHGNPEHYPNLFQLQSRHPCHQIWILEQFHSERQYVLQRLLPKVFSVNKGIYEGKESHSIVNLGQSKFQGKITKTQENQLSRFKEQFIPSVNSCVNKRCTNLCNATIISNGMRQDTSVIFFPLCHKK